MGKISAVSRTVAGGAIIIALFSIFSRILGLVRDRLLAAEFGAGPVTDAYYAAFRLPDLIFQTLVLGALSSALIPVFVQLYHSRAEDSWRLANGVLTVLAVTMGALALAAFIVAPAWVRAMVPGFTPPQYELTVLMTRIILVGVLLHAGSNVASAVLQGLRRFVAFAVAPVLYNLGLIVGIVALVPLVGPLGLAWGVVLGALAHLCLDVGAAWRAGWRPRWRWAWADAEVRQVWRLMVPRTFGLAANQVSQVVVTVIASSLAAGSLSQLTWADNLQNVPTNVFGVPLAIATFPVLAQATAAHDQLAFVAALRSNIRRILFLVVPAATLLVALRAHVVRVVLGSGAFDWSDTYHTAQIVGIFAVALVANSIIALAARSFYAQQDTVTPVRWALAGVTVSIGLALAFSLRWGVEGLAVAISAGAALQALGLCATLQRRTAFIDRRLLRSAALVAVNAALAAVACRVVLEIGQPLLALRTVWGVLAQGLAAGGLGIAVYLALSLITDSEDVVLLRAFLHRHLATLKRLFSPRV